MKRIFLSLVILFFCTSSTAFAKLKLQATIDYATMTLEDEAQILVTINGGTASEPVVPQVPGLDIVPHGKQSQFSFVNGAMSYSYTYQFTVIPSDKGEYTIPAFIAYSDGQEYKSNELHLAITAANYSQQPPQNLAPQKQQQNKTQNQIDQKVQEQVDEKLASNPDNATPFWLVSTVNKVNPFVSEQILYRFKFFSRVNVNLDEIKLPEFKDFYTEVAVPEQKGRENINGQTYTTYEIVYALSPLKSGPLHIDEAQIGITFRDASKKGNSGNWDPFGQMGKLNKKNLRSPSIDLEVRELPKPIPNDFANLVGQFQIEAEFDHTQIKLGDSTKLTVSLSGLGNLKEADLPDWNLNNFKIYKDKPLTDTHVTPDGIEGVKTFQLAFVPTVSGDLTLPELSLSYLDSETEKYVQLFIPPQTLQVLDAGQGQSSQGVFATNVNDNTKNNTPALKNILGLFDDVNQAQQFKRQAIPNPLVCLFGYFIPLLIVLLPAFKKVRLPVSKKNSQKKNTKIALRSLLQLLADQNASTQDVYLKIKELLTHLLGVNVITQTAQEIQAVVSKSKLQVPAQLFIWLQRLEQQNYSAQQQKLTLTEVKELSKVLQEVCQ